jgi:hypothetical protein
MDAINTLTALYVRAQETMIMNQIDPLLTALFALASVLIVVLALWLGNYMPGKYSGKFSASVIALLVLAWFLYAAYIVVKNMGWLP